MPGRDEAWYDDDSFWEATFPFMFGGDKLAAGEEEAQRIVELSGERAGCVLDIACGPGRHSVAFARAGFEVTGVDRTRYLLDRAREQAREGGVVVEWVQKDMRDFVRPSAFNLALSLYSSFGLFEKHGDNLAVLRNAWVCLRPGGKLVLDLIGKEILARIFEPTGSRRIEGLGVLFTRRRFTESFSRMENEWTLVPESGPVRRFHIRHWVYSAREIEGMLEQAGFRAIQTFGDFGGGLYGLGASRMITVAERAR